MRGPNDARKAKRLARTHGQQVDPTCYNPASR